MAILTVFLLSFRQGSGSACRSLNGGFVRWNMGVLDDGSDSNAEEVCQSSPVKIVLALAANDFRCFLSLTGLI